MIDEIRKRAYRHLIYLAVVDVRNFALQPILWKPWTWWRGAKDRVLVADFADAMHNLAQHSWLDFERFDEDSFWSDYSRYCQRHPEDVARTRYRKVFDDLLKSEGY